MRIPTPAITASMNEPNDVLAELQPPPRISEQATRILSLAESIAAARLRGCSWKLIASKLEESGIRVSADHLRLLIKKHKSNAKRSMKPRKQLNANVEKETNAQTNGVAAEPSDTPLSARAKPDSDHVIFRRNPNDPL
jgi:hypothetical protein